MTDTIERLTATARAAVQQSFADRSPPPSRFEVDLAFSLALDLTAMGLVVQDAREDPTPGGVWIAPSLDMAGVTVAWAQPDASAVVLGLPTQAEIQRQMNVALYDILRTLGYPVGGYGRGGAYIVTGLRPPLTPAETANDDVYELVMDVAGTNLSVAEVAQRLRRLRHRRG